MTKCDQAREATDRLPEMADRQKGSLDSAEVSVPCLLNDPGDCLQQVRFCLMVKAGILTALYPIG
jgi:hypothetical protein